MRRPALVRVQSLSTRTRIATTSHRCAAGRGAARTRVNNCSVPPSCAYGWPTTTAPRVSTFAAPVR